jgi:hypothetical protein
VSAGIWRVSITAGVTGKLARKTIRQGLKFGSKQPAEPFLLFIWTTDPRSGNITLKRLSLQVFYLRPHLLTAFINGVL